MTHPHLEGLIRKLRGEAERFRALGGDISIAEAAVFAIVADELEALAALPGGGVDEAMVDRACRAHYGERWNRMDQESPRRWMHDALTAALPAPNPHEADRNG